MDLNGDGHADILSGSYSAPGAKEMAGYFQVLWGQDDGNFKNAAALQGTDGKPLVIDGEENIRRICTRPFAVDWDADGDLDLLVGNFEGTYHLFRGEGEGRFSPQSELLKTGDKPLSIARARHSDPFCVDLDGDGDTDILSGGSQGGVWWAENTAGKGKPIVTKGFQNIVKPFGRREVWSGDENAQPAYCTRVWADDVNGDGKIDLLLGDTRTLKIPAAGLTREQAKMKLFELHREERKFRETLRDMPDEERQRAYNDYFKRYREKKMKICKEESFGYVWVCLQK